MKRSFQKASALVLIGAILVSAGFAQTRARGSKASSKAAAPKAELRGTLELMFVIDTTGSMSGLIEGAKTRVWGIINDVIALPSRPRVRVGFVAYRDKGDEYVTRITPLTEDLDQAYMTLMEFRAGGGGDTPENVRKALADGVNNAGWDEPRAGLAQILFLVGDAPPQNYAEEPDVLETTERGVRNNLIINTIQCGNLNGTKEVWQNIALRGEGKYFAIAQDGGVQAIATPYDAKLAELAARVGRTYVTYGSKEVQALNMTARSVDELRISTDAPMAAQADRAVNKAMNSYQYRGDLIQDIENKTVKLEDIKEENLPDDLKRLSAPARKVEIDKRIAERSKIRAEILDISKKRDAFIAAERAKNTARAGFDLAVSQALREQLRRRGIR